MSTAFWKDISKQINIGLYSSCEDVPVECTVRVRDFSPIDIYPTEVRKRAQIIKDAFSRIDVINVSWVERERKDILGDRNFTYGEVKFHSFFPLLQLVDPQPGEVFYDLGCGTGLPSAIAAIMFPGLAESSGAEYLEVITQMGSQAIEVVKQRCRE